ncbi:hypothetical protein GCM10010174_80830 [Kutzneria viridogrisea]|uniref:Uncharacterized protein n=1 Tax=Kutzneria viridogrisea TaxID=47990 RepID=A0ABR6BZ08_9PSEU|nr:hypothetical protein [Kutzneria viridogrisea]
MSDHDIPRPLTSEEKTTLDSLNQAREQGGWAAVHQLLADEGYGQ